LTYPGQQTYHPFPHCPDACLDFQQHPLPFRSIPILLNLLFTPPPVPHFTLPARPCSIVKIQEEFGTRIYQVASATTFSRTDFGNTNLSLIQKARFIPGSHTYDLNHMQIWSVAHSALPLNRATLEINQVCITPPGEFRDRSYVAELKSFVKKNLRPFVWLSPLVLGTKSSQLGHFRASITNKNPFARRN
jgi:hypothetical protein